MAIRWEIKTETKFKKQYKNLDTQTKQRINQAIQELRNSENPAGWGDTNKAKGYLHTILETNTE